MADDQDVQPAPAPNYAVKFPDGYVQQFYRPPGISDADAQVRAVQERGIAEGRIPTTWFSGTVDGLAHKRKENAEILTGVGMATGNAPLVAGAPLIARGIEYANDAMRNRHAGGPGDHEAPSASELGQDAVVGGAAAYGPAILAGGARGVQVAQNSPIVQTISNLLTKGSWKGAAANAAARTVAPAVEAGAEMLTPRAVGQTVSEIPGAVRTAAGELVDAGIRMRAGVTADEVRLMQESIAKGWSPSAAAKVVSGGDPDKLSALMTLYQRARMRP